jgi:MFS family permease
MNNPPASEPRVSSATALYLALLQFLFNLCWVVYAIYLPTLAGNIGIATGTVVLILMMDQAIFTVFDVATGVGADRMSRIIGKLGRAVAIVTLVSCIAFVVLPFITGASAANQWMFFAATIIWTATSSALRAPPIMLLGKYAAKPSLPILSAIVIVGYGVASALAPYLAMTLRDIDPRVPFALSSVALVLATFALAHVERRIASQRLAAPAPAPASSQVSAARVIFAIAMVVLALGYQLHFSVNTTPLLRKFTDSTEQIAWLTPIFWVGFNVAMFPATLLVKRWGSFGVMGVFGLIGAAAIAAAEVATTLNFLVIAQFAAGAAWGCILMSAFTAAFATGEGGHEGKMVGLLFSALAFATFLRMGLIWTGWHRSAEWATALSWIPILCWSVSGAALIGLAVNWARQRVAAAAAT